MVGTIIYFRENRLKLEWRKQKIIKNVTSSEELEKSTTNIANFV